MFTQQKKLDVITLRTLFVLAAGTVVTQTLGLDSLTSGLYLATFPLTVLLWVRTIRKTVTGLDLLMGATVAMAMVSVLLNAAITFTMPNFSYIKKFIMFTMSLMFFQTAHRIRVDRATVKFIHGLTDILVLYLIAIYFIEGVNLFTLNNRIVPYLTFRMGNPNFTGLFLICLYMMELYRLFTREKWYWKALHIFMAVFLGMFVVLTQSRNCLMIMILFTAFCAWLVFRGKNALKLGKLATTVIVLFPVLFMVMYLLLVYTPAIQNFFSFLVSEGKGLDSRIDVWVPALQELWKSPIIGAYSQISGGTGTGQMHNTHLDIACSYGIPVLVGVCVLLWKYLHRKGVRYREKAGYIYILSFACTLLLGMGEAALFSGGLGLYIFAGSFLALANDPDGEDNEEEAP